MNNQQRIIKLERDVKWLAWSVAILSAATILSACQPKPPIYDTISDMSCEEIDYDRPM